MAYEEVETSRRDILRAVLGIPLGITASIAMMPVVGTITTELENHTAMQTGNGSGTELYNKACGTSSDEKECIDNFRHSSGFRIKAGVQAPVLEEVMFRVVPSLTTDLVADATEGANSAWRTVTVGNGSFRLSRRELIGGAVSSVLFGAAHNITEKGYDTNRVPIGQVLGGSLYWYLQRKFGLASNIAGHAAYNLWATR